MSFEEFWSLYLFIHSKRWTKVFHVTGTVLAFTSIIGGFFLGNFPLGIICSPLIGYSFAWSSHLWIEHNVPETFEHPIFSFLGDLKLTYLTLTGRMPCST